jgi:hypothetical protein
MTNKARTGSTPLDNLTPSLTPIILPPQKPKQKQLGKTKNDLKRRAKGIVKALVDGMTETAALKSVGYSKSYAETHRDEILNNPKIAKTIREIYESGGISDEYLREKHKALLEAKEVKVFNDKENGITYSEPLEDNTTRLNALKLAHQIKGNLIEKTQETGELTIKVVKYGE